MTVLTDRSKGPDFIPLTQIGSPAIWFLYIGALFILSINGFIDQTTSRIVIGRAFVFDYIIPEYIQYFYR